MLFIDDLAAVQGEPDIQSAANEVLTVTVDVHSQGMSFGLSTQGTNLMNLLLANPIPRKQLNASIYLAMCPLLATMGPWAQGYGMRHDHFRVEIQVSVGEDGLLFATVPQAGNTSAPTSTVLIQEIPVVEEPNTLQIEADPTVESARVTFHPLNLAQENSAATDLGHINLPAPDASTSI